MAQPRRPLAGVSVLTRSLIAFFSFIILCIATLGFGTFASSRALLLRETTNAHADLLAQAQNEIGQRLSALRDIGAQLSMQADIKAAMYYDQNPDAAALEAYRRISTQLTSLKFSNSYIDDLYLYFRRADVIVSTEGKSSPGTYWGRLKNYQTLTPFENYIENGVVFSTIGAQRSGANRVVSFAQALPLNQVDNECILFIDIDESQFSDLIRLEASDNPTCLILSEHDMLIPGSDMPEALASFLLAHADRLCPQKQAQQTVTAGGHQYTLLLCRGTQTQYLAVAAVSDTYIAKKTLPIIRLTLAMALFMTALGAVVSTFLVRQLYRPLVQLVEYLRANNLLTRKTDELNFIAQFLKNAYRENQQLSSDLSSHYRRLRLNLLSDLLHDALRRSSETYALALQYLSFPYGTFQVAMPRIPDEALDLLLQQMPLHDTWEHASCYALCDAQGRAVLLLNYEPDADNVLEEACQRLCAHFPALRTGVEDLAIGQDYREIWSVGCSYEEAGYAFDALLSGREQGWLHIDAVRPSTAISRLFSREKETMLANYLKSGQSDDACALLTAVVQAPDAPRLSHESEALFGLLASSMLRAASDMGAEDQCAGMFLRLTGCQDDAQRLDCLLTFARMIAGACSAARQDHSARIYEAMVHFIEENYQKDISLSLLSDQIGYSDSYLSFIFKQQTGESFVDFVNKYRIERAKSLLTGTTASIASICEQCGFNSPNNFNRVFKKHEGITPGQFRKTHGAL